MFTQLNAKAVLFQKIQFNQSTKFKCKYRVYLSKTFLFQAIQFSQTVLIQTIQFSVSTVSMPKTVLVQTVQFSMSTQFKYQNSSISSNLV